MRRLGHLGYRLKLFCPVSLQPDSPLYNPTGHLPRSTLQKDKLALVSRVSEKALRLPGLAYAHVPMLECTCLWNRLHDYHGYHDYRSESVLKGRLWTAIHLRLPFREIEERSTTFEPAIAYHSNGSG